MDLTGRGVLLLLMSCCGYFLLEVAQGNYIVLHSVWLQVHFFDTTQQFKCLSYCAIIVLGRAFQKGIEEHTVCLNNAFLSGELQLYY